VNAYPEHVLQQAYAWARGHPRAADSLLGLALLACSADQIPDRLAATLGALAVGMSLAVTVALRRRDPVAAFAAGTLIVAAQVTWGLGPGGTAAFGLTVTDLAAVVLLYTLAAYRPRRISLAGLAVCLAGAAVAIARYAPLHQAGERPVLLLTVAVAAVTLLAAWVLGDSVAWRRAYYASLEERLAAADRARDLEEKRAQAVDLSAARLRRIERDLHDGAQVRLAALAMALGEIKENLARPGAGRDDAGTLELVSSAHQNAKDTLAELRDLARGIHPPVLDRGLCPALSVLAQASAVPVTLTVNLSGRPSPAIEAIGYFCTAELFANAAKHAAATSIAVSVLEHGPGLILTATDDGSGGAHVAPGGGLAGLRERVQTVDGRLDIDSPPGGPTTITIGLPRHA
jgi:signal transduction histidine kinase